MGFSEEIKKKKQSMSMTKWLYLIGAIILLIILYYSFFASNKTDSLIVTDVLVVEKGDLEIYVSGEGKIISGKKIELNFPVSGTIKGIYKNEGEDVFKGEKIAKLDDSSYKLELDKANINLKNAYAKLTERKNDVSASELNVLKKTLDIAQESYENTKLKLTNQLSEENNNYDLLVIRKDNLVKNISVAKSNLDLIKSDEDKKIDNLRKNLKLKGNVLVLDIDKYLSKIDELLGITYLNKTKNDSFEDYLGAKDSIFKNKVISEFNTVNSKLKDNTKGLSSNTELLISYVDSLKDLLNQTILVISNSIESIYFTSSDIEGYKGNYETYLSNLEYHSQDYLVLKNNLEYEETNKAALIQKQINLIDGLNGDLDLINEEINNYSEKLTNVKSINNNDLLVAKKQLDKAKLEYQNSISTPSYNELNPYYIAIEDAKSGVKKAEKNLSDSLLYSPVDGTILDINYKQGEYYGIKQDPFGVIISAEGKYIESYIEERDIANIRNGQIVKVNVDALDELSFTGTVKYVSSLGEEDKDEVTKYKILISFDNDNENLRDSMSVSLEFLDKKLEDILLIPSKYIIYKDGVSNVLLSNGTYKKIKEGISDGENTEILSGLKKGEKIGLIVE